LRWGRACLRRWRMTFVGSRAGNDPVPHHAWGQARSPPQWPPKTAWREWDEGAWCSARCVPVLSNLI
jgi:hypothetical protein